MHSTVWREEVEPDSEIILQERLQHEVSAFMDKGILLPFFKKYAGDAEVPGELADFM